MSRIELNVVATGNFRNLETSVAKLRTQVDALNVSMLGVGFNSGLVKSLSAFQDQFNATIDQSGMFERHMVNLTTETTRFGRSLESGSLRLGQLFRTATEYRRGELGQIRQLAREQVRMMNATTMRMADGGTQVIIPRGIDEGLEKQRILNQEYRIFRQVVQNGSTEIINWGKNTQWAGRQLTVGLTVPLTLFGAAAGKMFMDADKQLTRMAKVYGDATKGMVDPTELARIRSETLALSQEIARGMGVAVEETLSIAADIAATGKQGNELLDATREAMRLSVLGEVDRQEAMRATLAIQSVFKKDTEGLTQSINLLNAVENQTSATINDLVTGIVKAGPVVQGLGGDVEDLAAMMVAMREGGITASEAANAIKSSLASLINPTKQTTQVLGDFGIDIKSIVDKNAGDVIGTLMDLQSELSNLDELSRQRSIEQIFGKFQFSRINALLSNLGKAGSQTEQVFSIANMSVTELAKNAEQELTAVTESAAGKFQRAVETIKANLIPIGEVFIQAGTIILNIGNKILEVFNSLPDPVKNIVNGILGLTAVAGPIIMITGVLGNFFGYLVKGLSTIMAFKKEGRGAFELLTVDAIAARDANELLSDSLYDQATAMNTMASAVETLVQKLQDLVNNLKDVRTQTTGLNLDAPAREAMVAAEVSAAGTVPMAYGAPSGRYIPRDKTPSELIGPELLYSHISQESFMKDLLPEGQRGKVLGVGTVVDKKFSELNRLLESWFLDFSQLDDETVTTLQRRGAIIDAARAKLRTGSMTQGSYEQIIEIVNSMNSGELASFAPTWQAIAKGTAQYSGTLRSMAELMPQKTAEVTELWEQYRRELSMFGEEKALVNLKNGLRSLGAAVDQHIEDISQDITDLVMSVRNMPESERPEALQRGLAGIVSRTEGAVVTGPVGSLTGIGDPDRGYGRAMMLGAQQIIKTEQMIAVASQETIAEYEKVDAALQEAYLIQEEINSIAKQSEQAERDILAAKKKATDAWKNTFVDDQGRRFYGTPKEKGRAVPAAQVEKRQAQEQEALAAVQLLDQQQLELEQRRVAAEERKIQIEQEVARRKQLADQSYQVDLELIGATEEVIAATRELAATRKRKASTKDELEAVEEELEAATRLQSEKREQLTRAENEALLASTRSKEVRERLEANRARAAQELLEAEARLALITDKKASLVEQSILLGRELTEEEKQLTLLREKQSQEVVENIVSTQRNTDETNQGTVAKDGQTNAIIANTGAQQKDSSGLFRGGKAGGIISLLSMAGMFLPRPGEDTGLGQGMNAGINILNMAGMGAMFGGPGIAAGAGIGVLIESFSLLSRRVAETNKEMEGLRNAAIAASSGLLDIDKQFFQVEGFKGLEGLPLDNFKLKTEEATDRLAQFAEALLLAEEGTVENKRVGEIAATTSAQEFIGSSMFQNMIAEALLGGMSIEDIKVYMGGYLKAAGKEVYAGAISDELSRIAKNGGKNPKEIGAKYVSDLERVATEIVTSAGYTRDEANRLKKTYIDYETARAGSAVQITQDGMVKDANIADLGTFLQEYASRQNVELQDIISQLMGTYAGPTRQGLTAEQSLDYNNRLTSILPEIIQAVTIDGMTAYQNPEQFNPMLSALQQLVALSPDLANIPEVMSAIGNSTDLMVSSLINATASGAKSLDQFINAIDPSVMENNQLLIDELIIKLNEVSPTAANAFEVMIRNGVSTADALKITQMVINDIGTDWAALADLAAQNSIRFNAEVWTTYVNGSQPGGNVPASGASSPEDAVQAALGAIDYSGGGSAGGSSGSDYYDKLIEAQDKIIEGIQKEREERQKLLDIQEKQMDFALRRQDLENQIARAVAEGNLAEAALLQAELDAEQKKYDTQEAERKLQEREDKRIAAAEKEKERLQKLKEASSGGGGGASGGVSESQKQWTANRIEILTSGVVNWTEGAELRTRALENGPWSAFFNSDKVKQYRQELEKLGVPAENIDQILNDMFDSWIDNNDQLFAQTDDYQFISDTLKDMGVQGDRLKEVMPDVFGALLDKNLNPKEKIDIIASALYDLGYETDEAYRKAKKMYDQYNKDFDGKGIDDEIEKWINWNDRIKEVRKQLRKTYEEAGEKDFEYGNSAFPYGAPQSATIEGLGEPSTINAGGVQIDTTSIGVNMVDGMVQGWLGEKEAAATTIQSIAKYLIQKTEETLEISSPSKVYERIGKSMIDGLIQGLILPPESGEIIIGSMTSTFQKAIDSYKTMFTDPTLGISGVMDQEVTLASDNFYTKMTTRMQETVDEINRIVGGIKDYQFNIIGNPKIYTGGAPDIWSRVFQNVPASVFTNELPKYQTGGYVSGPGGPTEDKILAQLSNGEYVIKASSVKQYGKDLLDDINNRRFANGGYVSADRAEYAASRRPTYFGGTPTSSTGYNRPTPQTYRAPTYNASAYMGPRGGMSIPTGSTLSDIKGASSVVGSMLGSIWDETRTQFAAALSFLGIGGIRTLASTTPTPTGLQSNSAAQMALPAWAAGMTPEEYAKIPASERAIQAAWFLSNFAPIPGIPVARAAAKASKAIGIAALRPRTVAYAMSQAAKRATGTRNSRNIVARDYSDMLSLTKEDIENYVQVAYPSITDAQKAALIEGVFDSAGNLNKLDILTNSPDFLPFGSDAIQSSPGLRQHQLGLGIMDVLRDTSQAKRLKSVYDELVSSNNPVVGGMTFDEFISKSRLSSVSAADVSRHGDLATSEIDREFVAAVNKVYASQAYGISESDLIRLYKGTTGNYSSPLGTFRGFATTDPFVAKSFSNLGGGTILATDIPLSDLPQIIGTSGWADEFAQFIPDSSWAEMITDHGFNAKYSSTKNRTLRSYDPANALMPKRIPHGDFVKNKDAIDAYAASIGLPASRLLTYSGFTKVGPYWQLDLQKVGSISSKNKQLLKYMQDELGIDLVSLKTGEGLSPFRFADGGLVQVGADNLTLLGEGISNYAKRFVGTPYSSSAAWADGPANGWGCATATKWIYDSYAGVDVGHPSLSAAQYASGAGSKVDSKMPGDLLFFYYPNGVNTSNPINHVGMYTGGGSMFHARSPGLGTQITGVDGAGMARAQQRAGGSAIKRYMPMTIAGMGVPAGKLAKGGKVYGKGGPTTDEVLAWISNGEYVMNAGAVRHYGKEFMDAVNKGILPEAAMGGMFSSKYPGVVQKMAGGGMLMSKYGKGGMVSSSANVEYNINVNVAGTNASPDEIANKVLQTIKRSDKMKGATVRI